MYIIVKGIMAVTGLDGSFMAQLSNGDSFGELAALGMEKYRLISVRAETYCEMSSLTREDLMVMKPFNRS